ncbi:hypothetical protein QFZ82_002248 [Streptomyces sp. V4I23]|uniref:hypothetical protein n=1 Tax=Streptomyces sp. V4I23 TaxID=3042282 RepID=UPI0027840831|nr:hypothetical protein [Streptomyces sp. V4I23]MDQ1007763.1 hypothetical protein [Streptomyces sp. V4I23]
MTPSCDAVRSRKRLVAPFLTGHLIDAADIAAAGCTTAFLTSAAVMIPFGLLAVAAIRPERDARRLGADVTTGVVGASR